MTTSIVKGFKGFNSSKLSIKYRKKLSLSLAVKLSIGFSVVLLIFSAMSIFNHLRLQQLEQKDLERRSLSERQQNALALKTLVQQMDANASGYLLSNNQRFKDLYTTDIPELQKLVQVVGASAETREQKKWQARLKVVAQEFTDNFERAASIATDPALDADRRQSMIVAAFNASQVHKTTIFELVQSFYNEYTAADQASQQQFAQLIRNTSSVSLLATMIALLLAIAVAYFIVRSLIQGVKLLRIGIERVSQGDLSKEIHAKSRDELGRLSDTFDASILSIRSMLARTKEIAAALHEQSARSTEFAHSTSETNASIVRSMEEISQGATQQAEQAENSVMAIEQLEQRMNAISSSAEILSDTSANAKDVIEIGTAHVRSLQMSSERTGDAFQSMSEALSRLEKRSEEIGLITSSIQEISLQTNVLALNAAIESARAGEHGKGFAVIAEEVRLLSMQTTESSKQIDTILQQLRDGVKTASNTVRTTSKSFLEQQSKVVNTDEAFRSIVQLMDQFDVEISMIGDRVKEAKEQQQELIHSLHIVANVAQQTAAGAEETTAAATLQDESVGLIAAQANEMNELAEALFGEINKFKM